LLEKYSLMEGKTNKEIAAKLFITKITVKKHVSSMFPKTGTKKRTALLKLLMVRKADIALQRII
jgi:DNA-binding NarL/FixJ family response regulator